MSTAVIDQAPVSYQPVSDFQPVLMTEVELSDPLPHIYAFSSETNRPYCRAMVLVRLHSHPLGVIELWLGEEGLSPNQCAEEIWCKLHSQIVEHLRRDGLPEIERLEATGIEHDALPKCIQQREEFLVNPPLVSVVIATHNRTSTLAITLKSLLSLDYPCYEIIVVDNAPGTSETADYLQHTYGNSEKVRYVREDCPGLAVAHNRGLHEVKGSIVAFTDDDVIVDKHWLTEIVRGFYTTDNVGCVTGLILPGELESPAQILVEQYGGFRKGFEAQTFDLHENRMKSILYPYAVGPLGSGANMAFKTDALLSMNGFDPALGAGSLGVGGDDLAAFYQIITRGHKLVYQPGALVHHWDPREYAGLQRRAYGYGVGLTAYLTKCVVEKPWLIFDIAARLPSGLIHIFSAKSPKNYRKSADYPHELTVMERKGMLYGPIAYMRSYWRTRKLRRLRAESRTVS